MVSPVSETQSRGQQCHLGGAEQICCFQDFPWPQLWSLHCPVKWLKYELETTHRHSALSSSPPVSSGTCAAVSQAVRRQHRCLMPLSSLPPKTSPNLSQRLKREWGSLSSAGPLPDNRGLPYLCVKERGCCPSPRICKGWRQAAQIGRNQ